MVGQAIGGVLAEVAGFRVLAVCGSVAEACALIRQHPPQLLVLDVALRGEHYRDATDLLHALRPDAKLLFITDLAAEGFRPPLDLAAITVSVVDKAQTWDALLEVLRHWWQCRTDHSCEVLPGCHQHLHAIPRLSPRERRFLLELGNGQLNKQIASKLQLSAATVDSYRKSVAGKLGVSGPELVRLAVLNRCLRWHQPHELGPE